MYDPILAKSFSRYERRRLGFCAVVLSFVIALSICLTFKPNFHYPSSVNGGEAANLQLSFNAVDQNLLIMDGSSKPTVGGEAANLEMYIDSVDQSMLIADDKSKPTGGEAANLKMYNDSVDQNMLIVDDKSRPTVPVESAANPQNDTQNMTQQNATQNMPLAKETEKAMQEKPLCRILEANADYCVIEGDVRIDAKSSTIFLVKPSSAIPNTSNNSYWIIQPYPRKGISYVKNWNVTLAAHDDQTVPNCTTADSTHSAVLFSIGGFTGNHFHDFADILLPLFTSSFHFKREVHFLASDYKPWWPLKYQGLLNRLTKHDLVDIDREKQVLCYNKVIAGLQFHRELIIHPSSGITMNQFRGFLRQTYSLERKKAIKYTRTIAKPRLMIVSRKRTRILTNEAEVARMARKLGYEVVSAEADNTSNLTRFAQTVNTCDVMMGVHGAGLTNMVFLPDNAVLIQLVPFGAIDIFAKLDFGNPSTGMNIKYLQYEISLKESSLSQQYPIDHPVLKDPLSVHRKGWEHLRSVYLNNQNVTVDIHRFKGTLSKALKLLRR